jgi:Animal haem peroxidase
MESRRAAAPENAPRHGARVPRGLDVEPDRDAPSGRFGWMFPDRRACDASEDAIRVLADRMERREAKLTQNTSIPAGFTYLGQFIDHDITFDPTSVHDQLEDPLALENFRTPRLDLDSVYGSGPVVHPFLYDWCSSPGGVKLLVGHNPCDGTTDLPRNQQGRALIGDARNDEHVIISQLHLLFIQFHNAVVDHVSADGMDGDALLAEAQKLVRWHYQWIVVNEFLPKIVGKKMARAVFTPGTSDSPPAVHREHFRWRREPFIPFEFSGAAYRFGHSMVRDRYGIRGPTTQPALLVFPDADADGEPQESLAGLTWLTRDRVIHWPRFFKLSDSERPPQSSFTIDASVSKPLFRLPVDPSHPSLPSLPLRNLLRGRKLGLPSGQEIADAMHVEPLEVEQLRLDGIDKRFRSELERSTPLWYYILCEAATERGGGKGAHLGPVGGRIVAEVLAGLLEGDPNSFLSRKPSWRPNGLGIVDGDVTMADLVKFVDDASPG